MAGLLIEKTNITCYSMKDVDYNILRVFQNIGRQVEMHLKLI